MDTINAWWARVPGEHYWLDVTIRDGHHDLLAAPRGQGRHSAAWTHRLITHVQHGDVVFHFDTSREAIVAWSIAHGRAGKRNLWWPPSAARPDEPATGRRLPSWSVGLRQSTDIDPAVPLDAIARVQWDLFPALRTLEDIAGFPLYYPFEMGDRATTRPLIGYVFKLPAVFVQAFPELALAADIAGRPLVAQQRPVADPALSLSQRRPATR